MITAPLLKGAPTSDSLAEKGVLRANSVLYCIGPHGIRCVWGLVPGHCGAAGEAVSGTKASHDPANFPRETTELALGPLRYVPVTDGSKAQSSSLGLFNALSWLLSPSHHRTPGADW